MGENELQLFGGNWTEQKLDALEQYLQAYAKALSKTRFHRVYIDAFAGTGYREQRIAAVSKHESIFATAFDQLTDTDSQQFLDGSARIALRITPAFHRFVFIEYKAKKAAELEKLKTEFPNQADKIRIYGTDANTAVKELCVSWNKHTDRGVLFIDPFGMQTEWDTIRAVAATGCIDTWILFPFAANRLMTQNPNDIPSGWRERLNKLFGNGEWESRFYRTKTISGGFFSDDQIVVEKDMKLKGLGTYYMERLKSVFPVVAPNPRILTNSRGAPLFQLFFAAANPGRGGAIALKIAKHILDNI